MKYSNIEAERARLGLSKFPVVSLACQTFSVQLSAPPSASGIVVASGNALPLNCGLNNIRMVIGEHQKANEKNAHHNA